VAEAYLFFLWLRVLFNVFIMEGVGENPSLLRIFLSLQLDTLTSVYGPIGPKSYY